MTFQMFHVTDENPNDTTGGGGCVCSATKQPDCKPPYVVLPGNDMENISSPHVVVCRACAVAMTQLLGPEIEPADAEVVLDEDIAI